MYNNGQPDAPNPSLLAILLVAKSRVGPRLVLHYLPLPSSSWASVVSLGVASSATNSEADDSDDSTNPGSEDEDFREAGGHAYSTARAIRKASLISRPIPSKDNDRFASGVDNELNLQRSNSSSNKSSSRDSRKDTTAPKQRSSSKSENSSRTPQKLNGAENLHENTGLDVLGFSADALAKLLAPNSRSWHKKKLEVSLSDICFVGCPIFCREDGSWDRRKRKRKKSQGTGKGEQVQGHRDASDTTTTEDESNVAEGISPSKITETHQRHVSSASSTHSSAITASGASNANSNALLMFNVVFAMMPPQFEHQLRVKDMYSHVAKPLANALKQRQSQDGYVWNETCRVLSLRDQASEHDWSSEKLWSSITSSSSLAKALVTTYEAISKSQIADIRLGAGFEISLQIPQAVSTPFAPTPTAPQIPGLWLSSANLTGSYNDEHSNDQFVNTSNDATTISPHAALLLLVPRETLLKELTTSTSNKSPIAAPLSSYVKRSIPTRTISQLSKILRLSIADLQFLSLHLIRWRRARAIPPLHASHIYIVSPNADMAQLPRARIAFSNRFSALPDLVSILHKLGQASRESKGPIPWRGMIPSSDHKAMYMEALQWLVRGGWVCHLRTFAWIWVSPEVKREVHKKMKAEEKAEKLSAAKAAAETTAIDDDADLSESEHISTVDITSDTTAISSKKRVSSGESGSAGGRGSAISIVLPQNHRKLLAPHQTVGSPSETASVSSLVTAVRSTSPAAFSTASERNTSGGSHQSKDENMSAVLSPKVAASDKKTSVSSPTFQSTAFRENNLLSPAITPVTSKEDSEVPPEEFEPSLILSPHKASNLESRWLEHIGETLTDETVRESWPILVKHFDGRNAIEDISLIEGWKRKLVTSMISKLGVAGKGGVLRIVRHW